MRTDRCLRTSAGAAEDWCWCGWGRLLLMTGVGAAEDWSCWGLTTACAAEDWLLLVLVLLLRIDWLLVLLLRTDWCWGMTGAGGAAEDWSLLTSGAGTADVCLSGADSAEWRLELARLKRTGAAEEWSWRGFGLIDCCWWLGPSEEWCCWGLGPGFPDALWDCVRCQVLLDRSCSDVLAHSLASCLLTYFAG